MHDKKMLEHIKEILLQLQALKKFKKKKKIMKMLHTISHLSSLIFWSENRFEEDYFSLTVCC